MVHHRLISDVPSGLPSKHKKVIVEWQCPRERPAFALELIFVEPFIDVLARWKMK